MTPPLVSHKQRARFANLLLVTVNRRPTDDNIAALLAKDLLLKDGDNLSLTQTGQNELERLGFFLGLLPRKTEE